MYVRGIHIWRIGCVGAAVVVKALGGADYIDVYYMGVVWVRYRACTGWVGET